MDSALVAGGLPTLFAVKAAFDSLYNPAVDEFNRRFGLTSLPLFHRERAAKRSTEGRID